MHGAVTMEGEKKVNRERSELGMQQGKSRDLRCSWQRDQWESHKLHSQTQALLLLQ